MDFLSVCPHPVLHRSDDCINIKLEDIWLGEHRIVGCRIRTVLTWWTVRRSLAFRRGELNQHAIGKRFSINSHSAMDLRAFPGPAGVKQNECDTIFPLAIKIVDVSANIDAFINQVVIGLGCDTDGE